jgi:hypothetical protein
VATNLHSPSGKARQDGDQLSLGSVEQESWSLGLHGPGLTEQKEPGCISTHHDHADVPQTELLLRNTCILALLFTLMLEESTLIMSCTSIKPQCLNKLSWFTLITNK